MIVRDEAVHLPACLDSVARLVDEIVAVDTGSSDNSVQILESYGARVYHHAWRDDFAEARNAALRQARGRWVLFLDADERFEGSARALRQALRAPHVVAYRVPVVNRLAEGEDMVHTAVRLFRRLPNIAFERALHEQILPSLVRHYPRGRVGLAPFRLIHLGYLPEELARKDKRRRNLALAELEVQRHPEDAFGQANLAIELLAAGRASEAIPAFLAAESRFRQTESWQARVYKLMIEAFVQLGDLTNAKAAACRGLRRFPDYTDLYHLLGLLYLQENDPEAAIIELEHALRLGPADPGRHDGVDPAIGRAKTAMLLGVAQRRSGHLPQALAAFRQAVLWEPEAITHLQALVETAAAAGALDSLLEDQALDPLRLGAVLYRLGHYAAALVAFQRAEQQHPSLPYEHVLVKAEALWQLGQKEGVRRLLMEAGPPPDGHPRFSHYARLAREVDLLDGSQLPRRFPEDDPPCQEPSLPPLSGPAPQAISPAREETP